MASLIYTDAQGQREFPLREGVNRLGRVEDNDLVISDPSVSSHHCELLLSGTASEVRDLGSTNGTFINGARVQTSALAPGATLRLGNVELVLSGVPESQAVPIPATRMPAGASPLANPCRNHPPVPAAWECSKCGQRFCDACITDGRALGVPGVKFCPSCRSVANKLAAAARSNTGGAAAARTGSFGAELLAAWKYPFHRNGPIIMVTGMVFFTAAAFAQRFAFLIGLMIFVMSTGYWMAYAQKVVTSSAQGDDEPPGWPDFSDYYQDIILPFFHAAGLFLVYLLPALLALGFIEESPLRWLLAGGLLLVALFMMPMAWLAISMHDSIVGLSPHFVIPSILRIPAHYLAVVLVLILLVGINIALEALLEAARIPILGGLISSLLSIYFMMVICRLLGVLYHRNRHQLRWF